METNETSGSGAAAAPMTKEARDLLLASVHEIRAKIREGSRQQPKMTYEVRSPLTKQIGELLNQYFARLPRYPFGRCPVCNVLLEQVFDPWGLDGFWWQEDTNGRCPEPSGCEHFRVLTGALSLNGKPPLGGEAESHPGPDAPYVIPIILEMPTFVAVISSLPMKNGYIAYPISYFSKDEPPTPALANPWTKTSCSFTARNGRSGFMYKTDPWDFELLPWVRKNKVQWIEPGDSGHILKASPAEKFPYGNVPGQRRKQVIMNAKLFTQAPPHNEVIDPFSE
jgi:hypothetical protein